MSNRLEDLQPDVREKAVALIEAASAAGMPIRITHTLRSLDEQAHLYAQGRTLPGAVVTKARPGWSWHNFGRAFDICFAGKKPYPPKNDPRWLKVGQAGEALGLNWGGPNGKGDRFTFDRPHFEDRGGQTLAQMRVAAGIEKLA